MDFNDYQREAKKTAIYDQDTTITALNYLVPGLCAEVGEIAGIYAKVQRDASLLISYDNLVNLIKELGDVQWFISEISRHLSHDLNTVAELNLKKLKDRQERGVLGGSGDNR